MGSLGNKYLQSGWLNREIGWGFSDDLAIDVDRHRPVGLDPNLPAMARRYLHVMAMRSAEQRWQKCQPAPVRYSRNCINVKPVVIDGRIVCDHHATSIVQTVPDSDLDGLKSFALTVTGHPGFEAALTLHCIPGGPDIAKNAPAALERAGQTVGDSDTNPKTCDVEVRPAVDPADVDPLCPARRDYSRRGQRISWKAECSREIIRIAHGKNAKRPTAFEHRGACMGECAIPAANHNDVDVSALAADHLWDAVRISGEEHGDLIATTLKHLDPSLNSAQPPPPAAIHQHQSLPMGHTSALG